MEIPVVFITDNNFALPTGVAITSLVRSKEPETEYKIHVIVTEDVTVENKKMLVNCEEKRASVDLIEFDSSGLNEYTIPGNHVTPNCLLKFNISGLLPQYDKILYLDGDILVRDDLTELYLRDISTVYLGAVYDMTAEKLLGWHKKLNLTSYFNAGVLLLNSKKMREDKMEDLLYHIKKQNPDYACMDQDVFNDAVRDKVLFLPLEYNVQFYNLQQLSIGGIARINEHYGVSYKSLNDLRKKAVILHLTNEFKPWKYKDALFHKEWMSVFKKSSFHSQKLDLKKTKTEMALSFRIKRKTKSVIKRLPIVKQLLGRYSQLQNILWENNEILRSIQNRLNGKDASDLEKEINRLKRWDLIKKSTGGGGGEFPSLVFYSRGQFSQDAIAYMYFQARKTGFFVDIGASDGIGHNNTYALEQLGWRGFCVEPRPDFFSRLEENRHCDRYNVALSNNENDAVPFIISYKEERQGWSGIISTMPDSFLSEIEKYGNAERCMIPTTTFNKIMKKYPHVNHIDFLSIDCECHELNVLEGIDFNKYSFGLIAIEKHEPERLKEFLDRAGDGYQCFLEIESDLFFLPKHLVNEEYEA